MRRVCTGKHINFFNVLGNLARVDWHVAHFLLFIIQMASFKIKVYLLVLRYIAQIMIQVLHLEDSNLRDKILVLAISQVKDQNLWETYRSLRIFFFFESFIFLILDYLEVSFQFGLSFEIQTWKQSEKLRTLSILILHSDSDLWLKSLTKLRNLSHTWFEVFIGYNWVDICTNPEKNVEHIISFVTKHLQIMPLVYKQVSIVTVKPRNPLDFFPRNLSHSFCLKHPHR